MQSTTATPRFDTAALAPKEKLPRYISLCRDGYKVCLQRNRKFYRGWVPFTAENALLQAKAMADAIKATLPPKNRRGPNRRPRLCQSNTGYLGISETVKWVRNIPQYCFLVTWVDHETHKKAYKRIAYNRRRTRSEALAQAIALRAKMTGEPIPAQIMNAFPF